jgi:hypothetical protein
MDYDDPVRMVDDIRQHVIYTGHQVAPADDPSRQFLGYVCMHCEADSFWHCSALHIHALPSSVLEANMLRFALGSQARRVKLTEYLNDKTQPTPRRLSRYERKWVI